MTKELLQRKLDVNTLKVFHASFKHSALIMRNYALQWRMSNDKMYIDLAKAYNNQLKQIRKDTTEFENKLGFTL